MSRWRQIEVAAAVLVWACSTVVMAASSARPGWDRQDVSWRVTGDARIRAVRYPRETQLKMNKSRQEGKRVQVRHRRLSADMAARMQSQADRRDTTTAVSALVINAPPVDGFVPWVAVSTTDESGQELELDAIAKLTPGGSYTAGDPALDYAIGILDSGAGTHIIGNAGAIRLGLFDGFPTQDFLTASTVEVTGVTASVDVWVSWPLGLYIKGLGAVDPNTLALDLTNPGFIGQTNVVAGVGQAGQTGIPTAIGAPLAVYYASVIRTDLTHTINRDDTEYTAPDIQFLELDDPAIPEYAVVVPLELRPAGAQSVQYVPCLDPYGGCPDGFGAPQTPSIIIGVSSQSLFFLGAGVDLTDGGNVAIDRDRFMLDTGAQVSVVGSRVGARLALDPDDPEFEVEVQGVSGDVAWVPGFYIDTLDIPALGEWLSYTTVPVILLDVASPEGGTLDGIIGMNLFNEYNFVLRGGGMLGQDDPSLEVELVPVPIDADFDNDGDVDQADFGHLQGCLSGPEVLQADPDCQDAMLDWDLDVDEDDFGLFQACLSGPGIPAKSECTQ